MIDGGGTDGPRQIRVFLVDGTPSGLMTAELVNWTGQVLVAPRARLAQLVARPEANRTGVYLLIGPDPDRPMGQKLYVGEADNIRKRIRRHDSDEDMDFFDRIAFVVSKDENLTKAHARFLESQILRQTREAGVLTLANGTEPQFSGLPEADRSDMTFFLEQLRKVLPIIGFDLFASARHAPGEPRLGPRTLFELEGNGIKATAEETDEGFVILAGSTARQGGTSSFPRGYREFRDRLVAAGKFVDAGGGLFRLTANVACASPTAAAVILLARSASGPHEWKLQGTRQAYRDWRSERVAGYAGSEPIP